MGDHGLRQFYHRRCGDSEEHSAWVRCGEAWSGGMCGELVHSALCSISESRAQSRSGKGRTGLGGTYQFLTAVPRPAGLLMGRGSS